MPHHLYIDIETYSSTDLKKSGVYAYAEDPTTTILMAAWWFGNERDPNPDVQLAIGEAEVLRIPLLWDRHTSKVAHNAAFERILLGLLGTTHIEDWDDTQAMAAEAGLPQRLADLAPALGADPKDEAGTRLINLFSKPQHRKVGGVTRTYIANAKSHPEQWQEFCDYCVQDVRTLIDVHRRLPRMTDTEDELYRVDQRINDRGMPLDVQMARDAVEAGALNKVKAMAKLKRITRLANPNSVPQLNAWISEHFYELPDLRAETVQAELAREGTPDVLRQVLELRQESSLSSGSKYQAALAGVSDDSRLRGQFRFFGAHTGRWAGRGMQLQNLPRATVDDPDAARLDLAVGGGASSATLKALIRSLFVGPFSVCDYNAIEARVLAWLANERWALDAFLAGRDIYTETAKRMGDELTRAQGKVAVLALGYNGGANSLRVMGAKGTDAELESLKSQWRRANRRIVALWEIMGESFRVGGKVGRRVSVSKHGRDRAVLLPSGRSIIYRDCRFSTDSMGRMRAAFVDPLGRLTGTYGGKLIENLTQAVARDLLAHALLQMDAEGLPVVGHVHDEVIVEGDDLERVRELMTQLPDWAEGLPVTAEGFVTERYRKG